LTAGLASDGTAFEEIGEIDPAVDWVKQATHFDPGHLSPKAGRLAQAPRRTSATEITHVVGAC